MKAYFVSDPSALRDDPIEEGRVEIVSVDDLASVRVGESVVGRIYGHPIYKDGTEVVTSNITEVFEDGFKTRTRSYYF